jgi:hypothetical protein
VDVFAIVSGDSDFSPLVSKLRENAKQVIGLGVKNSSSDLLIGNCDEFIYYDDLVRDKLGAKKSSSRRKAREKGKDRPKENKPPKSLGTKANGERTEDNADDGKLKTEALELVLDTAESLFRDRDESIWGSMVKQTLKRKRPSFSESFHGYRSFNELLEDAKARGLLELQKDEKSGGYLILSFGPKA